MTKLVIDPALQSQLNRPLEFTSVSGETVGYFVTASEFALIREDIEERKRDYEHARAALTDEMIAAADASGGEFSYEELIERACSGNDGSRQKRA